MKSPDRSAKKEYIKPEVLAEFPVDRFERFQKKIEEIKREGEIDLTGVDTSQLTEADMNLWFDVGDESISLDVVLDRIFARIDQRGVVSDSSRRFGLFLIHKIKDLRNLAEK